jgi:nucleoside-diphosphate-sugar epimerase
MRVFVTGASGFIGSAVVPELISAGHRVLGLARSEDSAEALDAAGAEVLRGDLNDLASLQAGAADAEGVVHLGFIHDFDNFEASIQTDRRAIETMGGVLEGSDRPFVFASGVVGLVPGRVATEEVPFDPKSHPRAANAVVALALAERGVRISAVRLAPTVHGKGDHGFVKRLVDIARDKGVSGYVGEGRNRWPAVHRLDAAPLFRLALEKAPAGSVVHGVADEGVPTRTIAEIIGRKLGIPVASISPQAAGTHFGWLGLFFAIDQPTSSALTRERMGWNPTHPGLVEDLEAGHYTD